MRHRMPALAPLLGLCLALAASCKVVTVPSPLGTTAVQPVSADWDGTWVCGFQSPVTLWVHDAGTVRMTYTEMEADKLVTRQLEWKLETHGDWMFASAALPDMPGKFLWARVWREEEQIIAWLPDPEQLAEQVRAGALPGTVDKDGNVFLGELSGEHLDALTTRESGSIRWDEPVALVRVLNHLGFR